MDRLFIRDAGQGRGDLAGFTLAPRRERTSRISQQGDLDLPPVPSPVSPRLPIALTPDVERLLAENAVVAVGVSGGKDSAAVAIAVDRHLRASGHGGPRILIHADLGRIEWSDSLPACERLADRLGWELVVVRRAAGDLMDRWEGRWRNNVARYAALECVHVILPWSTPGMRFCTSELKTKIIASALKKRFPDRPILNVTGIRREESAQRRAKPVSIFDRDIGSFIREAFVWNPIIEWRVEQVWQTMADAGLERHEAYTVYGSSRVSCVFCIMSSRDDLHAASSCAENHDVYRALVDLEVRSTFGFQGNRWLADIAPNVLDAATRIAVQDAKLAGRERIRLEARLPPSLLYVKGWPTTVPTREDADLLAATRVGIASLLGIEADFVTGPAVRDRYRDLITAQTPKFKKELQHG